MNKYTRNSVLKITFSFEAVFEGYTYSLLFAAEGQLAFSLRAVDMDFELNLSDKIFSAIAKRLTNIITILSNRQ